MCHRNTDSARSGRGFRHRRRRAEPMGTRRPSWRPVLRRRWHRDEQHRRCIHEGKNAITTRSVADEETRWPIDACVREAQTRGVGAVHFSK